MKKLFIICYCLLLLGLVSCKKDNKLNNKNYGKIDYSVCGLYIAVTDYDIKTVNDDNPKIYFSGSNLQQFTTSSGNDINTATITNVAKSNRLLDKTNTIVGSGTYSFQSIMVTSVVLYPIYQDKNGELEVQTKLFEKVELLEAYTYIYSVNYEFQNIKYDLKINLKLIPNK